MTPFSAALEGARQIGFTVISISVSLVAAFTPLLFMGGLVGRLFPEFSLTLAFAIAISTVVSLTLTPMICAHFVKAPPSPDATWLDRGVESVLNRSIALLRSTLDVVLRHRSLTLLVFLLTIALTSVLYVKTPKGYFPQDDTGLIFGGTRAAPDISFEAMKELQQRATAIVLSDPAVAYVGSSVGASTYNARSTTAGYSSASSRSPSAAISARSRSSTGCGRSCSTSAACGFSCSRRRTCAPAGGSRVRRYQFTLWDPDLDELLRLVPQVVAKVQSAAGTGRRHHRP